MAARTPLAETARERLLKRKSALWTIRAQRDIEYREISQYLIPRLGRFYDSDDETNRSGRYLQNKAILDSSGGYAHRTMAAGLMAGMSSPARPWFRTTTHDSKLAEYAPVKLWLSTIDQLMRDIFSQSNTYRALHSYYEELGAFGTSFGLVLPNYDSVLRHYPSTVGEYAIASDADGIVNTFIRSTWMSIEDLVTEFGYNQCSYAVRNQYDRANYDTTLQVLHSVAPRKDRDPKNPTNRHMRFHSVYLEAGSSDVNDGILRESGFKRFPALAPRWSVTSTEDYGWSPGMEAIGDIRQLQHEQLRKGQAIDYQTEPPITLPTSAKGRATDRLPGGITFVDDTSGGGHGIRTMFETKLDLNDLKLDIEDVRQRLNRAFFADLFMMIANDDRAQITAREIAEKHEEKLLMLGPVLERLHDELLKPKIDITFDYIIEAGLAGPPPKELEGQELNIEFVSTLAQAQKAVGVGAVDRLLGTVSAIATFKPEIADKVDTDTLIDRYADMLGVDPTLIVANDQVALVRQDRAKQQQALQTAAALPAAAGAARDLSQANTSGKNGLTDVMNMFQGYTTGAPTQ